jgi:hypothetical protein
MINLNSDECMVLYLIFLKHKVLTDLEQLPKLKVKNGELSQIENKLYSGALYGSVLNG